MNQILPLYSCVLFQSVVHGTILDSNNDRSGLIPAWIETHPKFDDKKEYNLAIIGLYTPIQQ